jgi:hypothetical protein
MLQIKDSRLHAQEKLKKSPKLQIPIIFYFKYKLIDQA